MADFEWSEENGEAAPECGELTVEELGQILHHLGNFRAYYLYEHEIDVVPFRDQVLMDIHHITETGQIQRSDTEQFKKAAAVWKRVFLHFQAVDEMAHRDRCFWMRVSLVLNSGEPEFFLVMKEAMAWGYKGLKRDQARKARSVLRKLNAGKTPRAEAAAFEKWHRSVCRYYCRFETFRTLVRIQALENATEEEWAAMSSEERGANIEFLAKWPQAEREKSLQDLTQKWRRRLQKLKDVTMRALDTRAAAPPPFPG